MVQCISLIMRTYYFTKSSASSASVTSLNASPSGFKFGLLNGLLSLLVFWIEVIPFNLLNFHNLIQDQCLVAQCPHSLGLDVVINIIWIVLSCNPSGIIEKFSIFAMQHKPVHAICFGTLLDHLNHCGSHQNNSDLTTSMNPICGQIV